MDILWNVPTVIQSVVDLGLGNNRKNTGGGEDWTGTHNAHLHQNSHINIINYKNINIVLNNDNYDTYIPLTLV